MTTDNQRLSDQATILRIKYDKAREALSAAEEAYRRAKCAHDAAWAPYRDAAEAEGFCPHCRPAVPIDQCPGHGGGWS